MGDKRVVEGFPEDVILSKVLMSEKKLLGLKEGKHFVEREEEPRSRGSPWEYKLAQRYRRKDKNRKVIVNGQAMQSQISLGSLSYIP